MTPTKPKTTTEAPLTVSEAVAALLVALDLNPEATAELQINLKAGRVRVFGTDRSLRTRSYT